MDLAEELRASLTELFSSGSVKIVENGGRTTPQAPVCWEIRGAADKPLLHLWAGNCNLTRRVLSVSDHSDGRVVLAVERFGRAAPERMEIVRLEFQRNAKQVSREDYCEQLRRILAEQFPDETLEKLSVAADLEHTLSGAYVRGICRKGNMRGAFLAVPEAETQDATEGSLTYALLWLERTRQAGEKGVVSFLRLILPAGKSGLLAHQLAALDARLAVQVCELDSRSEQIEQVDPRTNGNVSSWLVPHRECGLLLDRAKADLAPLVALAPEAICTHAVPHQEEVALRFLGLPFALWREGRVYFGNRATWKELSSKNQHELKKLVTNLKNFRNPLSSDSRHPLFRAHAERWMQAKVMQDVSQIDVTLDPNQVYEQVIAKSGGQHGILDLLTITKTKRLVIIELKADENPELPLQAADYWERVRRHQVQGDLARYGYFPGLQLQSAPPIVYLVAPALRFHPTIETLLRYLSPEMQVIRVGLAESWRRGLRVVLRQ
jgi:hypothetical protein